MTEVKIRQVKEEDFTFMHNTLYKAWFKDENENKELAYALAEMDLNQFLNRATIGLAAEVEGEIVGFILAKVKDEKPVMRQLQSDPYQALTTILNAQAEQQAGNGKYLKREQEANTEMVNESKTSFDAEICLFIVDSNVRGLGIGRKLFHEIKVHFEEHDVNHYYLFTDDGCNYQFYERQKMYRSQSRPYKKTETIEESSYNFYLYENN